MLHRIALPLLGGLLVAGFLACSGDSPTPLATVPVQPETTASTATPATADASPLGLWELSLDFAAPVAALEPVVARDAAKISDLLTPDITPYLQQSPCDDCLSVKGLGIDAAGNLVVDLGLRHPFPSTAARADLEVFDTKAILLIPGSEAFDESPGIHLDGDGVTDLAVSGNFDLLRNADGYTPHFDGKAADPRYFNPPLDIPGTINPYRHFFTEDDPTVDGTGLPIPNRRFAQSPLTDVKRFVFALPPDGLTQLRVVVVLEASYGVSATYSKTLEDPGQPGARANPVYFLPAFNQPEAFQVAVELTEFFTTEDPPDRALDGMVRIADWQAGLTADLDYGDDLSETGLIPNTSDVEAVWAEMPGIELAAKELTRLSGAGSAADPYLYPFTVTNEAGAGAGDYIGLISVVDSTDGDFDRPTAVPGEAVHAFVAYQPFLVRVVDTGVNTPPVAVADATPNPVDSGATVQLIDHDSFDPDAGDSIALYAWDFDVSDGRTYTDATAATPDQASTQYINSGTEPLVITASLQVTDGQGATGIADFAITVNPPVGGNNPPVAVGEGVPNPVEAGQPILLMDSGSFDPDAGDNLTEYAWDFDIADGVDYTDSVSALPDQATTTYANATGDPLTITASLRVKDSFGGSDTVDVPITVNPESTGGNRPPVAVTSAIPNPVESGEEVVLVDSSSFDPDAPLDSIVEYAWDLDTSNGTTYTDSVSPFPNFARATYTNSTGAPVVKTASLRVTDTFGATGTDDIDITVNPGVQTCDPPVAPADLRVPEFPEPPYTENFITFHWNAVNDPCLAGYAVYRSSRTGADSAYQLLTDSDGDNQIDASELIGGTSWADSTLAAGGELTFNRYYYYIVRAVNDSAGTLVVSGNSNPVFVYINDFEFGSRITGGTWHGTRGGFVNGLVHALAYPDGINYRYGFEIATNGGNSGTHAFDESADVAAGGYGPNNNAPYAAANEDFIGFDNGYWNTFGPGLYTEHENSGIPPGADFMQMQLYHTYQLATYFDPIQGFMVAGDLAYVAVIGENQWNNQLLNTYIDLPVLEGKGYDSAVPSIPPAFDQSIWPPEDRDFTKQVPDMHFFAGDYQTAPDNPGAPDWTRSVFDIFPATLLTRPIVQFCFAGDMYQQHGPVEHPGWRIDDMLVIAY